MRRVLAITISIFLWSQVKSQTNCVEVTTDLTVTAGTTVVVNAYYPGTANALAGSTSITVGTERANGGNGTISSGDLLLIIQMQGAEINGSLPDIPAGIGFEETFSQYADGAGNNNVFGFLDNENFIAGQYEYAIATSSLAGDGSGGTVTLDRVLSNSYVNSSTPTTSIGFQRFQVIRVGNFRDLDIQATANVRPFPWNGTTGGVIAIDVLSELTLNGTIDANGAGFRGGFRVDIAAAGGTVDFGFRGEGIAGTSTQVYGFNDDFSALVSSTGLTQGYPFEINPDALNGTNPIVNGPTYGGIPGTTAADQGFGGPANAGGGGAEDTGGAGGGNGSTGGRGGESTQFNTGADAVVASPGDSLILDFGAKAYLGGGGGSGGQDESSINELLSAGTPGGGVIILRADTIVTGSSGTITANGQDGITANATSAGGGGAGGTIILETSSADVSGLTVNAEGGDGSSTDSGSGGGGGGGGGNVFLVRRGAAFTNPPGTIDVAGGSGGTSSDPEFSGVGGTGAVEFLTTPPAANLDCPLIALPAPTPGGIEGGIIWFRADEDVAFNGSNQVSGWSDFLNNGFQLSNSAITGLTGTNPDFVNGDFGTGTNATFNFNPSIAFNQGGAFTDYLAFNNFTTIDVNNNTAFVIFGTANSTPADQTIFSYLDNGATGDSYDVRVTDDGITDGINQIVSDVNLISANTTIRDGMTRLVTTNFDAGANNSNVFVNNLSVATSGTAIPSPALTAGGTFVLGQDLDDNTGSPSFNGAEDFQGDLAEIILFSRILTDAERQQVSSYLAIKYGITLDQSSPQDYTNSIGEPVYPSLSDAANYAAFRNDIAGLGRDDASALNQLRSTSINADHILTGTLLSGFTIDRQYVVWGNNDGALTFNTTEISAGINTRLQREWRVATLNSPGPISLSFDLTGVTNIPGGSSVVALVIDDDGDFSNGFLRVASSNSFDGTTATFENITLNDGEVLTIAEVPETPGGVSTDLTLWLRADNEAFTTGTTPATNGQAVNTWADQSIAGNDATSAATGAGANDTAPPTFVENSINFNPSIDFDGVNDDLRGADGFNTQEYFVVFEPDMDFTSVTADEVVIGFNTQALSGIFLGSSLAGFTNEVVSHIVSAAYARGIEDATVTISGPTLISSRNTAAGNDQDVLIDGAELDNDELGGFVNFSGNYILGDNPVEDEAYGGQIAEVISYSSRLTDTQTQQVGSYLGIKYGITLSNDYLASDGGVIYDVGLSIPANFDNNIAGIGRDDVSLLDQRKSTSSNSNSIVTIALTDNGGTFDNPNAFSNNLSFLVWGHDNDDNALTGNNTVGTIEEISDDLPSNLLTRLDREWRVRETGTVGTVTVTFDLTGITVTGNSVEDFLLVADAGGDFTNGFSSSFEATNFDAGTNIVTFEGVDFSDGDIFTLGTSRPGISPGNVTTNLVLWLRADEGISNTVTGTEVTSFTDQSSSDNDFTSTAFGANTGPSFVAAADNTNFNFNPSLDFTDDVLGNNAFSNAPTSNFEYFSVQNQTNTNINGGLFSTFNNGGSTNELNVLVSDMQFSAEIEETVQASANFSQGNTEILGITFNAGSNAGTLDINGVTQQSFTTPDGNLDAASAAALGQELDNGTTGGFTAGEDYSGQVAEVIQYNASLTAEERQRINSYLSVKYGITFDNGGTDYLASDGTTVIFPTASDPDFAAFNNDVIVIGQDDLTGLDQRQSSSRNAGAILQISRTAAFQGNLQFIALGNNGSAVPGNNTADIPSGIESRLSSTWKINLVNGPTGTVDFTFDLNGTGIDVSDPSIFRLIVDNDGDGVFDNANVLTETFSSPAAGIITVANVDLVGCISNGAVITLASADIADVPLPIELSFFRATAEEDLGRVLIEWQTLTETNNETFVVERSADGSLFEEIITIPGAGNSSQPIDYELVDRNPLSGRSFYRLRQIDFDGTTSLSNIAFVNFESASLDFNIFPNPTGSGELVVTTSDELEGIQVRMITSAGAQANVKVKDSTRNSMTLDVSTLGNGLYILEINLRGQITRRPVIVNR